MAVRARWGALATVLAVALFGGSALAGSGTTSADVPTRRTQTTALVRTSTADSPVQELGARGRALFVPVTQGRQPRATVWARLSACGSSQRSRNAMMWAA